MCVFCLERGEDLNHMLISCAFAWKVWMCCYIWLGLSTVLTEEPKAHFHQHSHLFQLVADSVGSRGLVSLDT